MHIYYRAYCDLFTNIAILGMAKPREKLNHQENRRKVCALCGYKIKIGKQNLSHFQITG